MTQLFLVERLLPARLVEALPLLVRLLVLRPPVERPEVERDALERRAVERVPFAAFANSFCAWSNSRCSAFATLLLSRRALVTKPRRSP
jgi:hypothetical protein